jgi:hypothetical protein
MKGKRVRDERNGVSHQPRTKSLTYIPNVELETILYQRFDVEALCRHHLLYGLITKAFKDRSFPRIVQSQNQYSRLVIAPL